MTDNLSPCPFCGGAAERIDIEDGNNAGGSFICCTVCQASSNVEFGFKENFVSNWNRRSTSLKTHLTRYAMVYDGEEGWIMLPDPSGEYVLFTDVSTPPEVNKAVKTESSWQWWAGTDEEWCTVGPKDSREAIIQAATTDCLGEFQDEEGRWKLGFHIVEARQDPLRMADWIEADDLLDRAEDSVADSDRVTSEYDDGPYFECTPAQKKDYRERIERACDEWQAAHGLVFTCLTFSHTRKNEHVVVDHPTPAATTEGSDRG